MTALLTMTIVLAANSADYPNAKLLIDAEQLNAQQSSYVILDARPREHYDAGHIPNARWVDHADWDQGFQHGNDTAAWTARIAQLGIDASSTVVVYDDNRAKDAARIWWILRYWGVEDVRLLNGGWQAWQRLELPVQTDVPAEPLVTSFQARAISDRLATKHQLLNALQHNNLQIVDARSEAEHCGQEKLTNRRAGAIPGAKHLEWTDLLDPNSGQFKPGDELRALFQQAGIRLDQPTAAHCQSGGRSSVMVFGMELMGAEQVSNYYPSFAEWSADENAPVVPGQPRDQ